MYSFIFIEAKNEECYITPPYCIGNKTWRKGASVRVCELPGRFFARGGEEEEETFCRVTAHYQLICVAYIWLTN